MPAIYAHRMFGERVVSGLSRARFFEIFQYPEAYALGLHGPDLLFYYRPLYGNAVRRQNGGYRARYINRRFCPAACLSAHDYPRCCPCLFRLPPNICRPVENGTILSTTGPQHDQRPKKLLRAFPRCCNVLFLRLRRWTGEGFSVFAASGAGIRCLSSWRKNYSRLRAPAASVAACLSASCPRRRGRAGSSAAERRPHPYRPEKTDTDRSRPSCPEVPYRNTARPGS